MELISLLFELFRVTMVFPIVTKKDDETPQGNDLEQIDNNGNLTHVFVYLVV